MKVSGGCEFCSYRDDSTATELIILFLLVPTFRGELAPAVNETQVDVNCMPDYVRKSAVRRIVGPALANFLVDSKKRSGGHEKQKGYFFWQCSAEYKFLDLGQDYFPRYIRTAYCSENSCSSLTICKPHLYKIKVLKRRPAEIPHGRCRDDDSNWLPEELRREWLLEDIPVTILCECVPLKHLN